MDQDSHACSGSLVDTRAAFYLRDVDLSVYGRFPPEDVPESRPQITLTPKLKSPISLQHLSEAGLVMAPRAVFIPHEALL